MKTSEVVEIIVEEISTLAYVVMDVLVIALGKTFVPEGRNFFRKISCAEG